METNETEIQTQKSEVEQTTENQNEEITFKNQEEKTSEEIKTLNAQKKHWREKAEILQKQIDEIKSKVSPETPKEKINKPNEPDYAKLAYLKAEGLAHPDDQKLVQDEADRLKLSLTDILNMPHIKNQLEINKDVRNAQNGMPPGTKRTGGHTQNDVDYYLANPDKRPDDFELAKKVLKAKQEQEKNSNKFSDILFE